MQLKNAIIFLVGFSAFSVMLNATGILSYQLPHQNISTLDSAYVTELTDVPATSSSQDIVGGAVSGIVGVATGFAFSMFTSLFSWVFTVIGVQPMLIAYGVPLPMAIMLESMLTLITIFSLIFVLANRSDKGVS